MNFANNRGQFTFSFSWFTCISNLISQLHWLCLIFPGSKHSKIPSHFLCVSGFSPLNFFFCSGRSIMTQNPTDEFREWEGKEKVFSKIIKISDDRKKIWNCTLADDHFIYAFTAPLSLSPTTLVSTGPRTETGTVMHCENSLESSQQPEMCQAAKLLFPPAKHHSPQKKFKTKTSSPLP